MMNFDWYISVSVFDCKVQEVSSETVSSIVVFKQLIIGSYSENAGEPYTLNFNGMEPIGSLAYVKGFELYSYEYDYQTSRYVVHGMVPIRSSYFL